MRSVHPYCLVDSFPIVITFSIRILLPLATYLSEQIGSDALERAARAASLCPADFSGKAKWITHGQFESFLGEARPHFADDAAFVEACRFLPVAEAWQLAILARQPAESSVALAAVYASAINESLIAREI